MKWRCALLQRWFPGYLDGELSVFWHRRLRAHLEGCPGCRQQLGALEEAMAAVKAHPLTDPGPEFWAEFSREMHLKLVQAAQEQQAAPAPAAGRGRLPYYLLGVPAAVTVLLLWTLMHYLSPERPVLIPAPQMAQTPQVQVPPAEDFIYAAALDNDEVLAPEEDITSFDLEPVIADLTEQEREMLLRKLKQREKDGSCGAPYFSVSWA